MAALLCLKLWTLRHSATVWYEIYMLLAGWEVRMVKTVTEFAGGGQPFQPRGHSFSLNGPNPLKSRPVFSQCGISYKVVQQKQFLLVVANPYSRSDFCTVNWVAFSEEIRQGYSTEILSNTATIREVNSTEIDSVWLQIVQRETHRITRHHSAELQTAKHSHTFKNLNWIYLRRLSLPSKGE